MTLVNAKHALLLALATVACAPSIGTIDRTQPNAIPKTQFEGLWYYRASVVSVEAGEGDAVEGVNSGLDKIRWQITEKLLIGYRSYEFIPFAEGLTDQGRDFFGSPVVAYPILSHFDIQRDYNKTTGVENNVLVENTTDRPWYERGYIRVDWTQNQVGGPTLFATGFENYPEAYFSGTALASYYTQANDETDPNRPIFTRDYFDVTNAYSVAPDDYYCQLLLLSNGVPRCGGQNVKVRLAFRKVDLTDDYQSLYYPDNVELKDDAGNAIVLDGDDRNCDSSRDPSQCSIATFPYFQAFGNFRINRVAFDRERNFTRNGRIYLAGRFNLWKDSYSDADGQIIPYEQRTPVPVVYYTTPAMPDEIFPGAQALGDSWNKPFSETVAFLQKMVTPDGRGDIAALLAKYGADFKMFQVKRNDCSPANVAAYAKAHDQISIVERLVGSVDGLTVGNVEKVCAAIQFAELKAGKTLDPALAKKPEDLAFQWQRLGDLRYNFQNYSNQFSPNSGLWGIAQMSSDPETGEYISNVANYFSKAGDSISQAEVDRIQWLNGEIDANTLLRGDVTRDVVVSHRNPTNANIHSRVRQQLQKNDDDLARSMDEKSMFGSNPNAGDDRFSAMFKGTDIERELLVTDRILRGFAGPTLYQPANGAPPNTLDRSAPGSMAPGPGDVSDAALTAASPVGWGMGIDKNPFWKAFRELSARTFETTDFFDPTMAGLADQQKGKSRDETYQYLRTTLYAAVEGHEVGHAVGLRHNFGASMDPLNYGPEFWNKYWNNPVTTANPNHGPEYKYASIMDYGFGTSTEGLHGIGEYDAAAIRFIYGELVDVWNPAKVAIPEPRQYGSFARRCGHASGFLGLPFLFTYMDWQSLPIMLSGQPGGTSPLDKAFKDMVTAMEANADQFQDVSHCVLATQDLNNLFTAVKGTPAAECTASNDRSPACAASQLARGAANINGARMLKTAAEVMGQQREIALHKPIYDDPATPVRGQDPAHPGCILGDESQDCQDHNGNGVPGDKGYGCRVNTGDPRLGQVVGCYEGVYHVVPYSFCPDEYAGYSPSCQPYDTGADFLETTSNIILRYDRDYLFRNFRRDAYTASGWGAGRPYMARLESRTMFHMTNVFRYYLYTRRTALDAPLFQQWAEAAYRGINFLERVIQTPEPGDYCLDTAQNLYTLKSKLKAGQTCNSPFTVGLGFDQGKYHDDSWTNEYFYKTNRVGAFYDKLSAIRQLTSSSGSFIRDLSDIFDRRAFTLGYMRAYEDPIILRFSALIRGDHNGYRSAVVPQLDSAGKPVIGADGQPVRVVRYMPFFDEEREDAPGQSVQQYLAPFPKIEPSWSFTLQYYALAYALANFSSISDSSPEFYRFTKIAIKGTPEDVTYGADIPIVTFTDPETLVQYVAPDVPSRRRGGLLGTNGLPAYQRLATWGIGAAILRQAQTILTNEWTPAKAKCDAAQGDPVQCQDFETARQHLNEQVGFIDIVRRFDRRGEQP